MTDRFTSIYTRTDYLGIYILSQNLTQRSTYSLVDTFVTQDEDGCSSLCISLHSILQLLHFPKTHTTEFQILLSLFSNLSSYEFMNYQILHKHQILQVQILGYIPAALHFSNLQLLVSCPLEFLLFQGESFQRQKITVGNRYLGLCI